MGIKSKPRTGAIVTMTGEIITLAEMDNESNSNAIRRNTLSLPPISPPSAPSASSAITPESTSSRSMDKGSSEDDNEEERFNFFLQCFSVIPTRTEDAQQGHGEHSPPGHQDTNSIASHGVDTTNHSNSTNTMNLQQDNEMEDEYETVLTGSTEEIIAVVAPSLLNDDTVLQSLRTTLYGTNQRSFDTIDATIANNSSSTGGNEEASADRTISRQIQQQQQQQQQHLNDPTVALFFKFFAFAQAERLKKPHTLPYFIIGLFVNLSDIRSDLEWAQDAAYRRQAGKPYISWTDYFAKERQKPWFTWMMLVVVTITMIWSFFENGWNMEPLRTNPMMGPSVEVLLKIGALKGQVLIEENKWWLLITPMFLHAGIIHLMVNSGFLWLFCQKIERNHGWWHTALVFLLSGMLGNMISALLQPGYTLVGASGGLYGLLGACVGDIVLNSRFFFLVLEERVQKETLQRQRKQQNRNRDPRRGATPSTSSTAASETSASDLIVHACDPVAIQSRRRQVRLWCYVSLAVDLFVNSLVGLLPFVDNFAHLGGLLFGFFFSLSSLRLLSTSSFDYRKKQQETVFGKWCHRLRIFALRCGGGFSALVLVFVAIVFLRRSDGTNSPCPNCRYASCMALPKPWKPNDPSNWWTCDGCGGVQAQVYWQGEGLGQEQILGRAVIFCPLGNTIEVELAEEGFTELEQAIEVLPDLCRAFCNES